MRNLKRVLSLALAAVMLMGMMIVGTSAANVGSFTDADKITNVEAASVTTAIGVFSGYGDGTFRPGNIVTRAEMAAIICKILSGSNVNADIFRGLGKFKDLDGYEWAEGYINMCYSRGIITGTGDTTYGPGDPVQTWQAALMLQRALGWWAPEANESISEVSVTARANGLGLYGDLMLKATDGLTRNDVAELVFNAITKNVPVEWNGIFGQYRNANVTGASTLFGGVVFNYAETLAYQSFGLVYTRKDQQDVFGRPATTWGYGRLTSGDVDSLTGNIENDVNKVTRELVTVADTPVVEYTTEVTGRTLYADLGLGTTSVKTLPLAIDGREVKDGTASSTPNLTVQVLRTDANALKSNDTSAVAFTGNGVLTQVFEIDGAVPGTDPEYKVVAINTYLLEVKSVASAARNDDAHVTVGRTTPNTDVTYPYVSTNFNNRYDTTSFSKGDVVLVTVALGNRIGTVGPTNRYEIQTMEKAESFTGTMTRFTLRTGTMAVDGVTYSFDKNASQDANEYNTGDTSKIGLPVTVYMDKYGYAIQVDGEVEDSVPNYAVVLAVDTNNAVLFERDSYWAQLLLMDGTKVPKQISVDTEDTTQWTYYELANRDTNLDPLGASSISPNGNTTGAGLRPWIKQEDQELYTSVNTLVRFEENDDGSYTLYKLGTDGIDNWGGIRTDNNRSRVYKYVAGQNPVYTNLVYTNDNTIMIVLQANGKFDIKTGVKNLPTINKAGAQTQIATDPTSSTLANVIFTNATPDGPAASKSIIYLAEEGDWYYDNDNKAIIPYTAVVNGEVRELLVRGKLISSVGAGVVIPTDSRIHAGGIYNSMTEKDGVITAMTVADMNDDYYYGNGYREVKGGVFGAGPTKWVTWNESAPVAYITMDGNSVVAYNTNIDELATDSKAQVFYGMSAETNHEGELIWVYVIDGDYADVLGAVPSIGGTTPTDVEDEIVHVYGNVVGTATVTVKDGGFLSVEGNVIAGAKVKVEAGGTLIIKGTVLGQVEADPDANVTIGTVEGTVKVDSKTTGTIDLVKKDANVTVNVSQNGSTAPTGPAIKASEEAIKVTSTNGNGGAPFVKSASIRASYLGAWTSDENLNGSATTTWNTDWVMYGFNLPDEAVKVEIMKDGDLIFWEKVDTVIMALPLKAVGYNPNYTSAEYTYYSAKTNGVDYGFDNGYGFATDAANTVEGIPCFENNGYYTYVVKDEDGEVLSSGGFTCHLGA